MIYVTQMPAMYDGTTNAMGNKICLHMVCILPHTGVVSRFLVLQNFWVSILVLYGREIIHKIESSPFVYVVIF